MTQIERTSMSIHTSHLQRRAMIKIKPTAGLTDKIESMRSPQSKLKA